MQLALAAIDSNPPAATGAAEDASEPLSFEGVYSDHFDFVWRSARRLGVPQASLDDCVQDVFLVVHRRLSDFEGRSSVRTWLFGIVRRVVRDHRATARERATTSDTVELSQLVDTRSEAPDESAARAEATRILNALLETLDDDKREAFVLSELEQFSVPEIAEATGVNVNTVYARVRAARRELEQALARLRHSQQWTQRCAK
ncbi:MAG: RNA polymerase sigma factor [Myxococcales bacterium]|nr:RNA polymerase sigma factor [Myxococcales bacterium]